MTEAGRVLVVDDQPENLDLIEDLLVHEGFSVTTASDGETALRAIEEARPDCVILDVMMPVMDGFTVCRILKANRRSCAIPIVMLTALSETTDRALGLNLGADDFLNKPVDQAELVVRVRALVRVRRLRAALDDAERAVFSVVQAIERPYGPLAGHSERVAVASIRLGRLLGLKDAELSSVGRGALLHDVGKVILPDRLLRAGRASESGDEEYRGHASAGESLLRPIRSFAAVREIVRHHHERRDGSGYPDGLTGEALAPGTEIVALCNRFDGLLCSPETRSTAPALLRDEAAAGACPADLVEALLSNDATLGIRPGGATPAWEDLLPILAGPIRGRVLVAADRIANRGVLEEILSTAGHEAVFVEDGRALLEEIPLIFPDLVIIDLQAFDPDGITLCEQIRRIRRADLLPVIVVLSWPEPQARHRAALAGVNDLLVHPVDQLELVARVKSLLRLRRHVLDLEETRQVALSLAEAWKSRRADLPLPEELAAFLSDSESREV